MAMLYRQAFCPTCNRETLHEKSRLDLGTGLILTVLTGGLFLPVWLFLEVRFAFASYRCQHCGRGNRTMRQSPAGSTTNQASNPEQGHSR